MHQVVGSIRKKRRENKVHSTNANSAFEDRLDQASFNIVRKQTCEPFCDDDEVEIHNTPFKRSKSLPATRTPKTKSDKMSIVSKFNQMYSRHRNSNNSDEDKSSNLIQNIQMNMNSSLNDINTHADMECDETSTDDANEIDSNTYSALSALLEIRRDATNNSGSLYGTKHKPSLFERLNTTLGAKDAENEGSKYKQKKRRISSDLHGLPTMYPQMASSSGHDCLPSVFHPFSPGRMIWDMAIISLILYTAIGVPLRLSWSIDETLIIWIFDRLLDLLFIVDIFINFNTAFERGTELIIDRTEIRQNYMSSWFTLDFIASFPFDLFIAIVNGDNMLDFENNKSKSSLSLLPRLVRLFKLSRLFRLARLQRILRRVQLQLGIRNSTNKILKFSGAAILCAHWMACMFYATSTFTSEKLGDFPSWVERLDASGKNQLDSSSVAHTYIASLYWSLTTMTSIGYGDVSPKTPNERIFGIFGMICGAVLFGHFMGNVLAVVADMSPAENEFHLKMDMLNVYMREQNLPAELRRQIEEFYHIEHKLNNYCVDEAEMLRELPDRLKRELSLAISKRILGNVPLFDGMSSSFVRTVGLSMERRVYPQGEYVIREGMEVTQFYILTAGRAYLMQSGMVIGAVSNGDYFGSIPIHWEQFQQTRKSTYSVRTLEWTEVRSLSIARFRQLIVEFPDAKDTLINRIVDNILEQNKAIASASASVTPSKNNKNNVIDMNSPDPSSNGTSNTCPKRRRSLSAEIDRDQLIRYVQNALCLNDSIASKENMSHRRSSLIPELKKGYSHTSIIKDLKQFEIETNTLLTRENEMKQKINKELFTFDCLIALLSLMIDVSSNKKKPQNGNHESNCDSMEREKELSHYIQRIQDRGLLPKVTKLRKVIQYFFISNKSDKTPHISDESSETENNEMEFIQNNLNSFFRPFIFIESQQSLKSMIQNSFTSTTNHLHKKSKNTSMLSPSMQRSNTEQHKIESTNRLLYISENNLQFNESVELIFFKLGYKPTFSSNINSSSIFFNISQDFYDIIVIDNDDITQIENTLKLISNPKVKSNINVLFLVTNNLNHKNVFELSKQYGVHIILRKPLVFQDLYQLFSDIGLLMFAKI